MILVLASLGSRAAASFVAECGGSAQLVTCADLAVHPTAIFDPDLTPSSITVSGRRVRAVDIRAVINLLPVVLPEELACYAPGEREYQASEFHALLTFFLGALPCPVVNRPTATSLSGPHASRLGWLHRAAALKIPQVDVQIASDQDRSPFAVRDRSGLIDVVWLCGRVVGASGTRADKYTACLARHGGVEYLRAWYEQHDAEYRLRDLRTTADVTHMVTRTALINFVREIEGQL